MVLRAADRVSSSSRGLSGGFGSTSIATSSSSASSSDAGTKSGDGVRFLALRRIDRVDVVGLAGGLRAGVLGGSGAGRATASETRPRVRFAGFSSSSTVGGELRRLLPDLAGSLVALDEDPEAAGVAASALRFRCEGLRPDAFVRNGGSAKENVGRTRGSHWHECLPDLELGQVRDDAIAEVNARPESFYHVFGSTERSYRLPATMNNVRRVETKVVAATCVLSSEL